MVSLRTRVGSAIGVLLLFLPAACATRPLDPWTDFAQSVMESARDGDVDALTRELTLYRWEEITEFYRQASVVDVTRGQSSPAEKELYDAMRADAQMFVRSYKDLVSGRVVKTCTQRLQIDGVNCYKVILWVRQDQLYEGILIHAVWQQTAGFRVLEWVDTSPTAAAPGKLWVKRARLRTRNPEPCTFPQQIDFEKVYK